MIRTVDAGEFLLAAVNAGLPAEQAMPCVVGVDGKQFAVDDSSDECQFAKLLLMSHGDGGLGSPLGGPGTELSRLLKRFGIEPTPTCACRAKAAEMDAWGCDECEKTERVAEVVAVMRAEAEARGLPFLDVAGQLLVKRAIRNARNA